MDRQQVLVVGGTDVEFAALSRACGGGCPLRPAGAEDQPESLAHDEALEAVLLVQPTSPELSRWRVAFDTARSPACLLVLADDVTDPRVDAWLEAGADDCAFRSHLELLPVTLTRLRRDRARRAQRGQAEQRDSLQRRLEGSVADAQKNEALVRFGTHIAHDVNNLLTVIIAHAQRLQAMPGKTRDVGQAILEATARGRELTQQVLTFGHHRPLERQALDLGPLVRATLRLLEATAPGVSMRLDLPAQATRVMGDEGQLNQVLTNLCGNALQALNGLPLGEGTLTVSLRAVSASDHPSLKPGPWVRLSVTDTGRGMDEATVQRVFEPFFSTRPEGGGTGLGLAVVQSIVQGHEGTVVVDSSPGKGSTFHVYLPGLTGDDARPGQGQHVMLVDDHPGMARVSAKLLETLGYRTSVFDDPREALAAFRSRPQHFDVVMTDLSMPQMSGEEFTLALREVSPTVPVIVSSGMASEADREELHRLGFAGVLLKPWRLEEAVATLKRVLPDGPRLTHEVTG